MNKISLRFRVFALLCLSTLPCYSDEEWTIQDEECGLSDSGFFLQAEAFVWIPHISGLEWGFGSTTIVETHEDCARKFSTEETDEDPHFDWNVGFRLEAGTRREEWITELKWTHYASKGGRKSRYHPEGGNQGHVKVQLDELDLLGIYLLDIPLPFSIYPIIGIRTSQLNHKIHADSTVQIFVSPDSYLEERKKFSGRQHFLGIGPLVGFMIAKRVHSCIDIYGSVTGSLLYGKYRVKQSERDLFTEPVATEVSHSHTKHLRSFDFNLNCDVGVIYYISRKKDYNFYLITSLEHQQYFNQNGFGSHRSDISFTGVDVSFVYEF